MRNPNGYGSCHKIGGTKKRRNPWRVRVTDGWKYDEKKDKAIQKFRTIGYFPNQREAMQALAEYNKSPATIGTAHITFEMLFELWKDKRGLNNGTTETEKQALRAYKGAYKHSAPIHNKKVSQITIDDLEDIMLNVKGGVALQKMIKTFWNQIFDFAVDRNIISRNISKSVKTRDKDSRRTNRIPFTIEQIQELWKNVDKIDGVDTILMMIYTGMRPSELLQITRDNTHLKDRYLIGGIKTDAGRDRVIPLHKDIIPLIEKRLNNTHNLVPMPNDDRPMQYRYYLNYVFNDIKDKLSLEGLTPHCGRHTFTTLATRAEIDERFVKMIVGHSTGDITDRYRHSYISTLIEQIDKITL